MCDMDADFDALLNGDGMADVDALLAGGNQDASAADTSAADTTVKVDTKHVPASQEAKQPAIPSTKPSLAGKKRQLLVPQQGSNKRKSLQMNPSATSGGSSLSPKASSPSPADPAPKPALADPESASSPTKAKPTETADPEPSAASTPTKAKPTAAAEPAEDTKAADDMEVDADKQVEADDTEMAEAAADEEPEVQSPFKKAPAPDADADADADEPPSDQDKPSLAAALDAAADADDAAAEPAADQEKPSTAAASGGTPSSKALAAGKRKGLTVAKAATGAGSSDPAPNAAYKPVAVKPKPKAPAASTSSSAAAGGTSEGAAQKMPKAQTAFFFFSADARPVLKTKEPGLSMPEYSKKLGEMWRELSDEEKKPYNDMAIADRERVKTEIAAMDPAVKAAIEKAAADARAAKKQGKTDKVAKAEEVKEAKEAAKAAAKEAKKSEKQAARAAAKAEEKAKKQAAKAEQEREKAGYRLFYLSQFKHVKADNPDLGAEGLTAEVLKLWEALEQTEKDAHIKQAEEAAEAEAAAKAVKSKAKPTKSSKSTSKRSKKASAGSDAEDAEDSDQEATEATGGGGSSRRHAAAAEDEDDDSDREDVDWEANPATGIFSRSDGAFLVARQGLMMTEYGKVDMRKAKARLLHGGAGSSSERELPVTTQEVEEYERACQKFWAAVKSRMCKGALDLEELEEGSPLEMCYVLGKLQEQGHELDPMAKRPKGDLDVVRRLPVMRLSMVMQRLLDLERSNTKRFKNIAAELVQAIKDKGDEGLKADDEAVATAATQLESS